MKNKAIQEVLDWLGDEIKTLKKEIDSRNETADQLQKLTSELVNFESYTEYKDKYDEIVQLYEKEKERLVKLHDYYQKMEMECEDLKSKVKGWEDWFYSNRDIFDRLFSVAPPTSMNKPPESSFISSNKDDKKKTKIKKMKK